MAGPSFLLLLVPFAHHALAVALPQVVNDVMVMTTVTLMPGQTVPSSVPDSSDDGFSSWSGDSAPVVVNKFGVKQQQHQSGNQGQTFQQNKAQVQQQQQQQQQQQPAPSSTVPVQPTTTPITTGTETSSTSTTGADDTTGAGSSGSTTCDTTPPSTMADLLDRHNHYRTMHQAGNLCWDASLASNAQQDSSRLGCGAMIHAKGEGVGENLMGGQSTGTAGAVDGWYNEISKYDWSNPGYKEETGHFTQVVWKGSTSLGCDASCG